MSTGMKWSDPKLSTSQKEMSAILLRGAPFFLKIVKSVVPHFQQFAKDANMELNHSY